MCARIGDRQERNRIEPIEPRDQPRLKRAERTVSVVEDNVGRAAHVHGASMRKGDTPSMRHFMADTLDTVAHFFVRRLGEVVIPPSDGHERFRRVKANRFVNERLELGTRLG